MRWALVFALLLPFAAAQGDGGSRIGDAQVTEVAATTARISWTLECVGTASSHVWYRAANTSVWNQTPAQQGNGSHAVDLSGLQPDLAHLAQVNGTCGTTRHAVMLCFVTNATSPECPPPPPPPPPGDPPCFREGGCPPTPSPGVVTDPTCAFDSSACMTTMPPPCSTSQAPDGCGHGDCLQPSQKEGSCSTSRASGPALMAVIASIGLAFAVRRRST